MADDPWRQRSRSPIQWGRSFSSSRSWDASRISRMLCCLARYDHKRPAGLQVSSDGQLSLRNLMEVWGSEQGLEEKDILEACTINMYQEGDDRTPRYSITSDENCDTLIRVHPKKNSGGRRKDYRRDHHRERDTQKWQKPSQGLSEAILYPHRKAASCTNIYAREPSVSDEEWGTRAPHRGALQNGTQAARLGSYLHPHRAGAWSMARQADAEEGTAGRAMRMNPTKREPSVSDEEWDEDPNGRPAAAIRPTKREPSVSDEEWDEQHEGHPTVKEEMF
eukprot:TRINITY_DN57053_c0_g1_i1.p1 TRINITY_DN57053_c0_g1~~TRINITY_DN57053_c0_g1_i1.p1  ORF type:complete len:286 (+),score=35.47 TRINITY_DN57053_c0_g1_i1:27-860(+)